MPKIIRKDLEPVLRKAAALNADGSNKGSFLMEKVKVQVQKRVQNGEHIHLYASGIEECINPAGKCWEGPRKIA